MTRHDVDLNVARGVVAGGSPLRDQREQRGSAVTFARNTLKPVTSIMPGIRTSRWPVAFHDRSTVASPSSSTTGLGDVLSREWI